ncbi:MAG: (2Fe-2S)-binding protein, partial [Caulobacteraceae bacterium]
LHEFAGRGDAAERAAARATLLKGAPSDVLRFEDAAAGASREAFVDGGRLERALFVTAQGELPPRAWLAALFETPQLGPAERAALLVGRPPGAPPDEGRRVCACKGVSARRVERAIAEGAASLDAIAEATGAGAGCGSCRPEIARMLAG